MHYNILLQKLENWLRNNHSCSQQAVTCLGQHVSILLGNWINKYTVTTCKTRFHTSSFITFHKTANNILISLQISCMLVQSIQQIQKLSHFRLGFLILCAYLNLGELFHTNSKLWGQCMCPNWKM